MSPNSTSGRSRSGPETIIHARDLSRIYSLGTAKVVGVDRIDLSIATGQIVVIKGNSGSGKSTLLSLFAGLDRPTSGRLTVSQYDMSRAGNRRLARFRREVVGMIFQAFNLLPTLSVLENICLPALLNGKPYSSTARAAGELMNWLGLHHRRQHLPSQLSGGEMQRTAIARALINNPAIILADEPTGNLDSRNGQAVMELLADLNRKWQRTVIIATHSRQADPMATIEIELKDGRIVSVS